MAAELFSGLVAARPDDAADFAAVSFSETDAGRVGVVAAGTGRRGSKTVTLAPAEQDLPHCENVFGVPSNAGWGARRVYLDHRSWMTSWPVHPADAARAERLARADRAMLRNRFDLRQEQDALAAAIAALITSVASVASSAAVHRPARSTH